MTHKFTPEQEQILRDWVKALRSGDFDQTEGALREQDSVDGPPKFCCLGVLCEVAAAKELFPAVTVEQVPFDVERPQDGTYLAVNYQGESALLPPDLSILVFGQSEPPELEFTLTDAERNDLFGEYVAKDDGTEVYEAPDTAPWTSRSSFVELNDSYGRSFDEIATVIEENFLGGKS
jgi:hypothetical protein